MQISKWYNNFKLMKLNISTHKFKKLSEISSGAGQVFFATLVISPIVTNFDRNQLGVIVIGIVGAITLWYFSLQLAERGKL